MVLWMILLEIAFHKSGLVLGLKLEEEVHHLEPDCFCCSDKLVRHYLNVSYTNYTLLHKYTIWIPEIEYKFKNLASRKMYSLSFLRASCG